MMKMSSNSAKSSKHHKNRSSMPSSSNVHNQKQMNRNSMRSSNGQMQTSVNHYNHNQAHQNTPRPNNVSNYSNSNNTNYNLDEVGINGVYKNGRLMHSVTSLIGCLVEVELANGDRYEGIFKTFSPEFDLVLFSAAKIINENTDKMSTIVTNVSNLVSCLEKKSEFVDKIVFHLNDMVNIKALNVDLDYATISKKSVLTDSEIAKTDGKKMQHKELVPWDDDGANNSYESLEENGGMSNGWNSADMFNYNEKTYNIKSTFRDEMTEYTIQLEQRNDDDYLKRQAQAESIAREIEKDPNRLKRLAKENDLDEETRFSAVVANKRDEPNNLSSNISSPRSEISHSSRDDRREPMRNNPDNAGFRTQNSRQNRNRGGANRNSGVNDSNWRETAARSMNSNRFNQAQPAYNNNNFNNPKQQTNNNPSSGYGPAKYPSGGSGNVSNVGSNQYSSASGPKSSYSAVSARHTSSDSLANENEAKAFPNRGHGNKSDHNYPNEDSYNRRSAGGLPQRDFKQRSGSRIAEHDSAKLSSSQAVSVKSEVDCSKSNLSSNISPATVTGTLPTSSNEPSQLGSQPKAPSPAKSESSHNQQSISKGRPIEDNNSQHVNSSKVGELKKQEQQISHTNTPPSTMPSNEASKQEVEPKNDLPQVSSVPVLAPSQPNSSVPLPTPVTTSIENRESTTPTSTCSTSGGNEVVKSSLNPNAKAFTPRSNSTPQFMQPSPQVVPNYQQYQAQHLSTTPPAPMPNQFIQMQHSLPQHHHHHPQPHQQQQAHQLARNNAFAMQFQPAYISSQIPPQYLTNIPMTQMAPNAIPPHTVFPGAVPAGVPNPAVPTQTAGPNQSGPGQLPSHHMVPNPTGPQQTVPNQNQQPQGPQSRGSYRGSNKGANNHNSGPHQQNQQYIRQHQVDYSQQTQVANVTGQPIMAATAPQAAHQMPVAYSAASVLPQHHNQTQQHGQQPPNMAQMVPQPNPMQYMQYARHFIPQGHQINLAAPMQPGLYDPNIQMMICDHCPPQMVPTQPIPTAVPQTNPNLQSSAPSISSSAPSNQSTANQVSQGAAPQAPLNY